MPEPVPAIVYASPSIRNGKIVQGKVEQGVKSLLVEFDTAGIPRSWHLDGQCFTKERVAELINSLREDAKFLSDKADMYETWLERQSMQAS